MTKSPQPGFELLGVRIDRYKRLNGVYIDFGSSYSVRIGDAVRSKSADRFALDEKRHGDIWGGSQRTLRNVELIVGKNGTGKSSVIEMVARFLNHESFEEENYRGEFEAFFIRGTDVPEIISINHSYEKRSWISNDGVSYSSGELSGQLSQDDIAKMLKLELVYINNAASDPPYLQGREPWLNIDSDRYSDDVGDAESDQIEPDQSKSDKNPNSGCAHYLGVYKNGAYWPSAHKALLEAIYLQISFSKIYGGIADELFKYMGLGFSPQALRVAPALWKNNRFSPLRLISVFLLLSDRGIGLHQTTEISQLLGGYGIEWDSFPKRGDKAFTYRDVAYRSTFGNFNGTLKFFSDAMKVSSIDASLLDHAKDILGAGFVTPSEDGKTLRILDLSKHRVFKGSLARNRLVLSGRYSGLLEDIASADGIVFSRDHESNGTVDRANFEVLKKVCGSSDSNGKNRKDADLRKEFILDLFSSSFFDISLLYYSKDSDPVSVYGLSSGEFQIFGLLMKMLYFMEKGIGEVGGHFIVVFDEPDAYLHPEWSRRFVGLLHAAFESFSKMSASKSTFQALVTTHSPIMLSDVPKAYVNVLSLVGNDDDRRVAVDTDFKETFLNNLYSLFVNPFFVDSFIGEFATRKYAEQTGMLTKSDKNKLSELPDDERRNLPNSGNAFEVMGTAFGHSGTSQIADFAEYIGDALIRRQFEMQRIHASEMNSEWLEDFKGR